MRCARLAERTPGGAFDPADLARISPDRLGYAARWAVHRYACYGMEWEATGLRLESADPGAAHLPWIVIVHGGSANFYEFFVDPLNAPGLGQYLAQAARVLLVNIPGNYRADGWPEPFDRRQPAYAPNGPMPPEAVRLRNAVFTNRLVFKGVKGLIGAETEGDCLIVGHSTAGELAYLALNDAEMSPRLKGRFLGWGSGGPAGLRKQWELQVGIRERSIRKLSAFPPLWRLRTRNVAEYVHSGYIGPLNPCGGPESGALQTATRWLAREAGRRPNFKQVMQDMEHRGMTELRPKLHHEISEVLTAGGMDAVQEQVFADMFAASAAPLPEIDRGIWVVGKWDRGHWNRQDPLLARERLVVDRFSAALPGADLRIVVLDLPMTHYGHIEKPRELAAVLTQAARWLSR